MTTTTIYSTTGTAPIGIEVVHPTPGASDYGDGAPRVLLTHEDGTSQAYRFADVLAALGIPTGSTPTTSVDLWPGVSIEVPSEAVEGLNSTELEECADAAKAAAMRVLTTI